MSDSESESESESESKSEPRKFTRRTMKRPSWLTSEKNFLNPYSYIFFK